MTTRSKGLSLLVAQLLLVGSVAGKYAWERHTCPRVWTRATQYDPEQPLRGRYLALTLHPDACGLPPSGIERQDFPQSKRYQRWDVLLRAKGGRLITIPAKETEPDVQQVTLNADLPCQYASLDGSTDFFISEHAKTPFPLAQGQELWAEVTVPPSGPPRPVQLAVSDGKSFHVLDLR